jgi:hypothetical protein
MYGFDIDDTLAHANFKGARSEIEAILGAKVIYTPSMPFVAITARGNDPKVQKATKIWLNHHQPKCTGVEFVSGGMKEKINGKARAIQRHNVTDYVDNNTELLAGLKKILPNVKLYHFDGTKPVPF